VFFISECFNATKKIKLLKSQKKNRKLYNIITFERQLNSALEATESTDNLILINTDVQKTLGVFIMLYVFGIIPVP